MKIPSDFILLGQPWQEKLDAGFQQSRVQLDWKPDALHLRFELEDAHIVSTATAHNQRLFLIGDTAEVFLKIPGSNDYLELHVCPGGYQTAFRWPDGAIETIRESHGTPLENFQIDPESFASCVEIHPGGWNVDFTIPPVLLGCETWSVGQSLQLSVCRYDYAEFAGTPIISTIASHRVANFHEWRDWPVFLLV